jgi:hypothetical protein
MYKIVLCVQSNEEIRVILESEEKKLEEHRTKEKEMGRKLEGIQKAIIVESKALSIIEIIFCIYILYRPDNGG